MSGMMTDILRSFLRPSSTTVKSGGGFLLLLLCSLTLHAQGTFRPGETWNDTNGSAINAHGGCVQYADGTYYWFGENRSGSKCNGISCYSSTDLYNWKKLSNAMTPTGTMTDECVDVAQGRTFERPKVIYNALTGKWVMWVHWENGSDYGQAKVAVLTSDRVQGPYTLTPDGVFRPNGLDSRDQTLFLDADGRAYHVSSTNMNYKTHFIRLTDDFTRPSDEESVEVLGMRYEAASMFSYGESYWCLFSGCDGWNPNRGRFIWNNNPLSDWSYGRDFYANNSYGRDFCVDNGNLKCYTSQPAYVFPVQGRDRCFIYMGDRWNSGNVGGSKYVWLPLSIRSGYPAVRWKESWNLSFFDHLYDKRRVAAIEDGMEGYLLEKYSDRIVSRPASSFQLQDDAASNTCFIFHATDDPYCFRLELRDQRGKYLESIFGSMRLMDANGGDGQLWKFTLEEDGYYVITNVADGNAISISGNSTQAGTSVALLPLSVEQHHSLAVYYDSTVHPEYEEADMYSRSYREQNRLLMAQQAAHEEASRIEEMQTAEPLSIDYILPDGRVLSERPDAGLFLERTIYPNQKTIVRKINL